MLATANTKTTAPSHLFTFAYNKINDEVSYWNASGARTEKDEKNKRKLKIKHSKKKKNS
jgi:hypothetical protein